MSLQALRLCFGVNMRGSDAMAYSGTAADVQAVAGLGLQQAWRRFKKRPQAASSVQRSISRIRGSPRRVKETGAGVHAPGGDDDAADEEVHVQCAVAAQAVRNAAFGVDQPLSPDGPAIPGSVGFGKRALRYDVLLRHGYVIGVPTGSSIEWTNRMVQNVVPQRLRFRRCLCFGRNWHRSETESRRRLE